MASVEFIAKDEAREVDDVAMRVIVRGRVPVRLNALFKMF
jgi:hypothetical protein